RLWLAPTCVTCFLYTAVELLDLLVKMTVSCLYRNKGNCACTLCNCTRTCANLTITLDSRHRDCYAAHSGNSQCEDNTKDYQVYFSIHWNESIIIIYKSSESIMDVLLLINR